MSRFNGITKRKINADEIILKSRKRIKGMWWSKQREVNSADE